MANYLTNTSKDGATDSQIFNNTSVENYSGDRTIANDNDYIIPQNSFLFAFKYYSWINNVTGSKVKLSLGDAGGLYEDIGNTLPEHNDEFNHFVLKGSNTPTTTEGYLGMYASGAVGIKEAGGSNYGQFFVEFGRNAYY